MSGLTRGLTPLLLSRDADQTLTFPAGVGYTLAAHQMLEIELHAINLTAAPISSGATTTFVPMPDASYMNEAAMLLLMTTQFTVPPNDTFDTGTLFQALPGSLGTAKFTDLTGLENSLGTSLQAWAATSASDTSDSIYSDEMDGHDPMTATFVPPLPLSAPSGFAYECTWSNLTANSVGFGAGYYDELCGFVGYYYPSHGFELCTNGTCSP